MIGALQRRQRADLLLACEEGIRWGQSGDVLRLLLSLTIFHFIRFPIPDNRRITYPTELILLRMNHDYTTAVTGRRPNKRLPDQAKDYLQNWFDSHVDNPYPTEDEKATFMEDTGLRKQQVDSWFQKARKDNDAIAASKGKLPGEAKATLSVWFEAHKQNPYPTEEEKGELMESSGLRKRQIESWFEKERKAKGIRKNHRLPDEAKVVFEKWLDEHQDNPYPTEEEKGELVEETGLKKSQVEYWFEKARKNKGLNKQQVKRKAAASADANLKRQRVELGGVDGSIAEDAVVDAQMPQYYCQPVQPINHAQMYLDSLEMQHEAPPSLPPPEQPDGSGFAAV